MFAQHGQPQVPSGCCTTFLAASACPAPALVVWGGQPPFPLHSQWLALRSFSWESHPMKFLRGVMFAVWVHGYARRMWHPFVCGVCGVLRAAQGFRLGF